MRLLRTCAALFAVLLLALPAVAQEQTGSIQGVVKDSSGAVLPGVTVEARSPSAVGVSTAVTNAEGIYRFPALPPGIYEVSASLQSFVPAKVADASPLIATLTSCLPGNIGSMNERTAPSLMLASLS